MKLLEDDAKAWLRLRNLPVPEGRVARTAEEAGAAARALGGRVALKALVAAGRRGKAGGVKIAEGESAAQAAARAILGLELAGQRTTRVYVEAAVEIAAEHYLSFGFGRLAPQVIVSRHGGVDIEAVAEGIIMAEVDPIRGLRAWQAADLWDRAGIESRQIPSLAALTAQLYDAFRAADALMLEVNPLAVTREGTLSIVGTMMEIDANALYRHPDWQELGLEDAGPGGRPFNERELAVIAADRKFQGGAIRYTEVPGDIALFVSGGGAGLLQHDLMLAAGGRPANHSDLSPASIDKPAALFDAMFANPAAKGLLIGVNYLQLLPCTLVIEALLLSIARNGVDPRRFPIVVRVFGPKEDEARRLAATVPGIRYLPHGASLEDGVREIVALVECEPGAMSILIDSGSRVLVQGATGAQARFDIRYCLEYGTRIVAGVTPGRGGEAVEGVPVFNTVAAAVAATGANASAVYVPARGVKDAVLEAVEGGIRVLACFAENVPRHDAAAAVAAARAAGARMAGFNTNGMISPGRCKLGGIGGDRAAQIYSPGRIGVCSRSGGMSAEICWTLSRAGLGASSCISMGGDPIVGMRMVEVLKLFEADGETDACVIFGEPGGTLELEVAEALRAGEIRKPVVALIAGEFQERYPAGVSFGHFAAVIKGENDSASAKRRLLAAAGAAIARSLEEIPTLLNGALRAR